VGFCDEEIKILPILFVTDDKLFHLIWFKL